MNNQKYTMEVPEIYICNCCQKSLKNENYFTITRCGHLYCGMCHSTGNTFLIIIIFC